ncbi:hypothetical protein Rsub_07005 [Raphidocelis subcapitata]|uniref:Fatty acid desaturase domain-containing protein n=1 Tax=Raphidocelis subcapitata TaxID=307507 RepID=A0A2V0P3M5_9CHLO|nr:hypothetical protein Rsub_07005 [Raphidocelis subcapitata]|eukprot:GBF94471.1 hypothetical protein Rsub_07005 [Raphidocelis subcapitata]
MALNASAQRFGAPALRVRARAAPLRRLAPPLPVPRLVPRAAATEVSLDEMERLLPKPSADDFDGLSYSEQYDRLFSQAKDAGAPLPIKSAIAKPDPAAQAAEPGAKKVLFSSVYTTPKSNQLFNRTWNKTDVYYAAFMAVLHGLCLLAPITFSWSNVALFFGTYFITGCLGITLSFHRQLSHKSFQTPKWLEYALAYCGVLAVQGDPIEWVSSHRYHHLHTDTPLDPHSPYEGFWWSHMGWLLDNQTTLDRVYDRKNAADLESQPFYTWIRDTYAWHVVVQFAALYALGGLGAVVWGGALRMCWVYHVTWFVNSASHVWGYQDYATGDQSRNNWWVGILAFGEGWHNNHHCFEYSARHGFEWWQVDMTWYVIKALQTVGLATNVKLPTERQKERLRIPKAA